LVSAPLLFRLVSPKETSMTAQHILVPTDFSAYADQALNYAIALAQALQARLTLLHVFHLSPLSVGDMLPAVLAATLQEMETKAQQRMQATLARIHHAGLQVDSAIIEGMPLQTILDTAQAREVDLIVMGTHGRTGLTHVLMGSVAEKVVRLAPCPVLVTRGTTDASTADEDTMPDQP
jgi:nucleotide-binding universal stress UspA family protein